MEQDNETKNVTIADIAKRAGVSSATVSYVLSERQDVKIAEKTREHILAICRELGYTKGATRKTPGKKQVTIDDIAREAGVSTATVSYIINDRKDVKISEQTRRKVLQICNLRQYMPSAIARLLAGKKTNQIGVCIPYSKFEGKNAEYYALLTALLRTLKTNDYGTVLLSPATAHEMRTQETLEGIICIDLTEEEFYALKENSFVPIVAVGMIVSNPLFFRVYTDHRAVLAAAKELLHTNAVNYIAYPYRNAPYMADLREALQGNTLYLADEPAALRAFIEEHAQECFVFADELLAAFCAPFLQTERVAVLSRSGAYKGKNCLLLPFSATAERAVEVLQSAIRREENKQHTCLLAPERGTL